MSPLTVCPKCKQRRFDPWAFACERRQCGYVDEDHRDRWEREQAQDLEEADDEKRRQR